MKEKYDNLTDFINDILEAAEIASKNIVEDIKTKDGDKNKSEKIEKKIVDEGCIMNNKGQKLNDIKENQCSKEDHCLKQLPGNITIDNFDHYILNEMCGGWPTLAEYHLYFESFTEDGYKIPGITETQLLAVLYNRYKNNPKKLDLIRQLMN